MSLERLDQFFGSDKSKQTLLRTQQAFQIASRIENQTEIPVRVVIRDATVVVEADSPAAATKLSLFIEEIARTVAAVIGLDKPVKIRVKRTGRLE